MERIRICILILSIDKLDFEQILKWNYLAAALALIAVTSIFLKKNWYEKLPAR
jgi:hypothetical protein